MLVSRRISGFIGLTMLAGVVFISNQAQSADDIAARAATCPALPEVVWWKTTHVKIVKYVDRKYSGNWDPYIVKWENYQKQMLNILESNGTALVKSRDIRLKGKELAEHIEQIEQRLAVTRCLKSKFSGQVASNESGTAGGAANDRISPNIVRASIQPKVFQPEREQVSAVTAATLDIEVTARCDGDTPTFQVTNLGKKWPRLAAISVHRTDGNALVSKRRMRLDNSQQATFKIRKRGRSLRGEVGLFVQPAWAKRPFRYDSKVRCR